VFLLPLSVELPTYAKDNSVIQGIVTKVLDGNTVVNSPDVIVHLQAIWYRFTGKA